MAHLIEEIINGIRAGDEEAFLGANEVACAYHPGLKGSGVFEPYVSILAAQPPTEDDAAAIKSALVEYLRLHDAPHVAAAAFALGTFEDKALVPFMRECLANHLRRLLVENAVVGNLMRALDNCGERVMTEGGYAITWTEKTIADARLYLSKFGFTITW